MTERYCPTRPGLPLVLTARLYALAPPLRADEVKKQAAAARCSIACSLNGKRIVLDIGHTPPRPGYVFNRRFACEFLVALRAPGTCSLAADQP